MPINLKKSSLKYKDHEGNMQDLGLPVGGIITDITLTKLGVSADAKATGEKISHLEATVNDLKENGTGTGEGVSSTIKQAIATILDAVLIDTNKQTSVSEALAKIKAWAYGGTAEVLVSQTGSVLTLSNVDNITSITQTGKTLVLA